ncbi:hypothetical protein TEA_003859 [Camellia sinensis var. sinensis]|uniref:Zinc finger GRF-type domain-containing protein n=1 Tax=Camellia sinensis var. sinensis TaxID=542762 RepID=A0A4S4EW79_CAMSN|nr:hypothetical protein TEA_003859 [Camellia sinensis var. sinensis]
MAYVDHAFSISDEDIMMDSSYNVNNHPLIKEIAFVVSLIVFRTQKKRGRRKGRWWTTVALLVLLCCFAITGAVLFLFVLMGKRKYVAATMGDALLQMHEYDSDGTETSQSSHTSVCRPRDVTPSLELQPQRSQPSLVPTVLLRGGMVVVVLRESRNGDDLLYAPEGLKQVVIDSCNKLWKDHKHKTKTNHYKPFKNDPNINEKVPLDILPEQWWVMVEYWSSKDAMKIASRNSKNRELRSPVHRTGRTPFADVRHKMMTDEESTNKMSVFMKTRMITDPDVKLLLVQDKIFHNLVGNDGHGYCKTHGIGVPRSAVYKKDVSPSQASSSSTVEEITQQVCQTVTEEIEQRLTVEIEQRVTEKLKAEFEQVRAWMDFIRSQGGLSGIQLPNASSGRQQVRKSVGDHDSQDDELLGSPVQKFAFAVAFIAPQFPRIDMSTSSNNDAGFFQNKRCKCGKKAGVYISESEKNPGKLYFKCANKACDYFAWGVPPTGNGSNIQKSRDDYDFARNNEVVNILERLDANQ